MYAYASTTAEHEVNYIATIVYVDRYLEDVDEWGHVDCVDGRCRKMTSFCLRQKQYMLTGAIITG